MEMHAVNLVENSIRKLRIKLKALNLSSLDISAYNKKYLSKYIDNYDYFMHFYKQLLTKAIDKLPKPVSESVFVDYGGGCGILSYLAKEVGFKTVIYDDIYPVSVNDAKIIAGIIHINIDYFIYGDIDQFVTTINSLRLKPDLICSFDVLEHIYDWRLWIKTITKIDDQFSLLFMTSANSKNPFINRRLKKIQVQAENKGFTKYDGWKESDLNTSFLEERKKIIASKFENLKNKEINLLAKATRGLIKTDIEKVVDGFLQTGNIQYKPVHSTNTCDPYTGNWAEHLINIDELKTFIKSNDLNIEITNVYHSYSKNKLLDPLKYLMNLFMKILGNRSLFLSPMYVLEIEKK